MPPIRPSHYLLAVPRPEPAVDAALNHYNGSLFDTDLVDLGSSAVLLYPGRGRIKTDQSKFGGASLRFLGAPVHSPDHADFALGAGDFCFSFWVRFETGWAPSASVARTIISQWFRSDLGWLLQAENNRLAFYWSTNGTNSFSLGAFFPWVADVWYHVEVNRASNVLYFYVDGNYLGSSAITDTVRDSGRRLKFGANPNTLSFEQDSHISILRGWMDDFILFKGVAKHSGTANFAPTAAFDNTDPSYASVKALMHFEGADASTVITDEKGHYFFRNGNAEIDTAQFKFGSASLGGMAAGTDGVTQRVRAWTPNGNAQIDTAQFKFGGSSGLFDGNGDWINTANHVDFHFSTGSFTVETWARFSSVSSVQSFLSWGSASGTVQFIFDGTANKLQLWAQGSFVLDVSWTPSADTWYHIAWCRSGNDWRVFVDGTQVGTTVTDARDLALPNHANGIAIGRRSVEGLQYFVGWLDDFRVTKGVARYTANFTAPTSAHPHNLIDDTDFDSVVTLLNFEEADASTLFADYPRDFDILINTPFTIETFARITAFSGSQWICGKMRTGNDANNDLNTEWGFYFTNSTTLNLYHGHRGVNQTIYAFTVAAVSTGAWHHVLIQRDALNRIMVAVDGVWSTNVYTDGKQLVHVSKPLTIGCSETAAFVAAFNGWIDEFRFTPGVSRYTFANVFTPPAAPYDNTDPNYANASIHLLCNGSDESYTITDEKGKTVTAAHTSSYVATGRVKAGFGQSYYGDASGSGCGYQYQDSTKFRFGANDFTISFWVWLDLNFATCVSRDFLGKRHPSINNHFAPWLFHGDGYFSARRLRFYASSNGTSWNLSNGQLFVNDMGGGFHYVSVSRRGPNVYGHEGGVLRWTQNWGTTSVLDNAGAPVTVLNTGDGSLACGGYLEELRILKGTGLYTNANYTPPTAPW